MIAGAAGGAMAGGEAVERASGREDVAGVEGRGARGEGRGEEAEVAAGGNPGAARAAVEGREG